MSESGDYMRGFERAIRELRDKDAWLKWASDPENDHELYGEDNVLAANYLEARRASLDLPTE